MQAVMRHIKSPQPINPPEELSVAERSAVGRLISALVGSENARRRDREAAAAVRKAATKPTCTCHTRTKKKTVPKKTATARLDSVPPPPDLREAIRAARGTDDGPPPVPDPYGLAGKEHPKAASERKLTTALFAYQDGLTKASEREFRAAGGADDLDGFDPRPPDTYDLEAARAARKDGVPPPPNFADAVRANRGAA